MNNAIRYYSIILILLLHPAQMLAQPIKVQHGAFKKGKHTYRFIGANYWYGGLLAGNKQHGGVERLRAELDVLKAIGVKNLRVFLAFEGDSSYSFRVYPSLQPQAGVYRKELLKGFDVLLHEMAKRDMYAVMVLNNNWEWSGGFGQYLEWHNYGTPPLPKTDTWNWEAYCQYISQFYSCKPCQHDYLKWVGFILSRRNSINGTLYKNDTHIMAWELANEPRPMQASAKAAYFNWILQTSQFIKTRDPNHLVTIGTEGSISTAYDSTLWQRIHALPNIDYATIHLWPKTWQWYDGSSAASVSDTTLQKTEQYIARHAQWCNNLQKPLVIEEFGLHRDANSYAPTSTVINRNKYYEYVFKIGHQNNVQGFNFWGFAGLSENVNAEGFIKKGMAYSADPPQEEQGIYSVFITDTATLQIIKAAQQYLQPQQ